VYQNLMNSELLYTTTVCMSTEGEKQRTDPVFATGFGDRTLP